MSQRAGYRPSVSSAARIGAKADDAYPGVGPFERPQVQTVKFSNLIHVSHKAKTPAAPQSLSRSGRHRHVDEVWAPLPLADRKTVHFGPDEPPTHRKQSGLRNLRPSTESPSFAALFTKVVVKRRRSIKVSPCSSLNKSSSTLDSTKWSDNRPKQVLDEYPVRGTSLGQLFQRGASTPQLPSGPQVPTGDPFNTTRYPLILQPDPCLSSVSLPESGPDRRTNRNTSVYRPSTNIPPIYSTSNRTPSVGPIPGLTVIMPVGDIAPLASTGPATSPLLSNCIQPLPPVPKLLVAPLPPSPEDVPFRPIPTRRRRRVLPASLDDLDYREVITSFLECDNPAFYDCPGMMDWATPYLAAPAR